MSTFSKEHARILMAGLFPDGGDIEKLSRNGRAEVRAAVELILDQTPVCRHHPCACQDGGITDPTYCDFVGHRPSREGGAHG